MAKNPGLFLIDWTCTLSGSKHSNPTAGAGDPSWYEWAVGLAHAVEMLDPDGEIESVNFQATGVKGLDDVVVTTATGTVVAIQVKHTRADDTLTFGDLLKPTKKTEKNERETETNTKNEDQVASLLSSLAVAWAHADAAANTEVCPVLYTNRALGKRRSSTKPKSGEPVSRPGLDVFWPELKRQVERAESLDDVRFDDRDMGAWAELLGHLSVLDDDQARLEFLRLLDIQPSQPELEQLKAHISARLRTLFGVEVGTGEQLLHSLFFALSEWTVANQPAVTAESVYAALAVQGQRDPRQHQLAPPTPFFESRSDLLQDIEALLDTDAPVVFVTGPPGSGKTSVVSQLANRRDPRIHLRFHAFRPIEPDNPVLPKDSDQGTSATVLWSDLLAQLRERLRGELATYRVPVRSDYLSASGARKHVLRITSELAEATGTFITIAIDGIDHAARAGIPEARTLLDSLVPPEKVPRGVCFLIAGQDPAAYTNYPLWLTLSEGVVRRDLPRLRDQDVVALLHKQPPPFKHESEGLARTINQFARGNTLSVLFAVHEAGLCSSPNEVAGRLRNRRMSFALDEYYQGIWTNATDRLEKFAPVQAAGAFCYVRGRIDAALLSSAFPETGLVQWRMCLESLQPLIVRDGDGGFRVLHNDVAVFLSRVLRARQPELKIVAGLLADHLIVADGASEVFHASIFELLALAGRAGEHSSIYTPAFVRRAWLLNRPIAEVKSQGLRAMESALASGSWDRVHHVGIALQDLFRIDGNASYHDIPWPRLEESRLHGASVPSELSVTPRASWNSGLIARVCSDLRQLAGAGELDRAVSTASRWFGGLTALDIVAWRHPNDDLGSEDRTLTELGACLAMIGAVDAVSAPSSDLEGDSAELALQAEAWLARGMFRHAGQHASRESWQAVLDRVTCYYFLDVELALYCLVTRREWEQVHAAIRRVNLRLGNRLPSPVMTAIGLCLDDPIARVWAYRIAAEAESLACDAREIFDSEQKTEEVAALAFVCAWTDRGHDPETVASRLVRGANFARDRFNPGGPIVIRCAAIVGSAWSWLARSGLDEARGAFIPGVFREIIELLAAPATQEYTHKHPRVACALLEAATELARQLGGEFVVAVNQALIAQAETAPGGPIGETLWRLLRRQSSDRSLLAQWCSNQVGPNGRAWTRKASERLDDARRFCALAEVIDEHPLAEFARRTMLEGVLGFQFRKDYVLGDAQAWLELALEQGTGWTVEHAAQLLGLSRMADEVGEKTLGWRLELTINRCFVIGGPPEVFDLWQAAPAGDWLAPEGAHLIRGLAEAAKHGELDPGDVRAIWCLAVGTLPMLRDGSSEILGELHAALGRVEPGFASWARSLTPAEATAPRPFIATEMFSPTTVAERIAAGETARWSALADFIASTRAKRPEQLEAVVHKTTELLAAHPSSRRWSYDERRAVYKELAACNLDPEFWWSVANAILEHAEPGEFRLFTISENIEVVCYCVARARAGYPAGAGLERHLQRALSFADVPQGSITLPKILRVSNEDLDWPQLSMLLLVDRLGTDDSLGIETSLRGLALLLDTHPTLLPSFARLIGEQTPRATYWTGLVIEWLAARRPSEVRSTLGGLLTGWLASDDPRLAIQAWASLATCARLGHGLDPTWPIVPNSPARVILPVGAGFLDLPPKRFGAMVCVSGATAARSRVERIERVLGGDLSDLEALAAATSSPSTLALRSPSGLGSYRQVSTSGENDAVLSVVAHAIGQGRWHGSGATHIAQALADADDPFVLVEGSQHPSRVDWGLLDEFGRREPSEREVERLGLQVITSGLGPGEVVLGGACWLFTSSADWYVELHCTTGYPLGFIPTARCFALHDHERYEEGNHTSLTVSTGGLYEFIQSSFFVFPSRELTGRLGWDPAPSRPTALMMGSQVAACYETIRGPKPEGVYRIYGYRIPVVGRWTATEVGWAAVEAEFGSDLAPCLSARGHPAPAPA